MTIDPELALIAKAMTEDAHRALSTETNYIKMDPEDAINIAQFVLQRQIAALFGIKPCDDDTSRSAESPTATTSVRCDEAGHFFASPAQRQCQCGDMPNPAPSQPEEGTAHPHAALLGFMGWLTSRDPVVGPFSARHGATEAAELVAEFAKSQGWPELPDDWTKQLRDYPASPSVDRLTAHRGGAEG
jgi:hypothetical protein